MFSMYVRKENKIFISLNINLYFKNKLNRKKKKKNLPEECVMFDCDFP